MPSRKAGAQDSVRGAIKPKHIDHTTTVRLAFGIASALDFLAPRELETDASLRVAIFADEVNARVEPHRKTRKALMERLALKDGQGEMKRAVDLATRQPVPGSVDFGDNEAKFVKEEAVILDAEVTLRDCPMFATSDFGEKVPPAVLRALRPFLTDLTDR